MDDWVGKEARDPAQAKDSDSRVHESGKEGDLEARRAKNWNLGAAKKEKKKSVTCNGFQWDSNPD